MQIFRASFSVWRRALLGAAALALTGHVGAQTAPTPGWADKPITIVVPFAPGGTTDIIARLVGQKLSAAMGQSVLIDNRAGAGGTLAAALVTKAPADGHTFLLATIAHAIAPSIYPNLSYDFQRDLAPVGLVATTPNVLLVNPQLPVKSAAELVAYIKAHPGQINFGSAGNGSTEHLSGELFRSMTQTQITHVPYKGGSPMMADLMGGQIQMAIETSPSAQPQVHAGKVRALAVTTLQPSPAYPGVPTMAQAGLPGYEVVTWFALMAPRATAPAIVERMNAELSKVLLGPDLRKRFEQEGVSAGNMPLKDLPGFIHNETVKWGQVAKSAGLRVN